MATAQTIINRAMRLNGLIGSGESPTSDESADGLTALNAMLESWATERLNIYAFQDESLTLVVAQSSYTIGTTPADLVTTRPQKIESVYMRRSNIDYSGIEIVSYEKWNSISSKTVTSDIPTIVYYEPTMPKGTLKVFPVPTEANVLHLTTRIQLTAFAAVSTAVSLPPGYERTLAYNLAVEFAPEFEQEAPPSVQKIAMESLANIKRANQRPMIAIPDISFGMPGYRRDIYADGASR